MRIRWLLLISVAFGSVQLNAQTTRPDSPHAMRARGGRDPSLPEDTSSPVIRTLPPARKIEKLEKAPLYGFSEREVDVYLKHLSETEPDPIKRVVTLARKNIGHFGIVAHGPKGEVNMIHSAEPAVREQGILDYIEKNEKTLGMKFLRAKDGPQALVDAQVK